MAGVVAFVSLFFSSITVIAQENASEPNIIFILADDFGYGSLNSDKLSEIRNAEYSR